MCCVWISEQAATFAVYNIERLDVYGSVHRNINLIERTNKM